MAGDPAKPGGEGAQPQDPATGEGEGTQNVHKLERDVANRDKRIRELEEQLAEATGGQKTAGSASARSRRSSRPWPTSATPPRPTPPCPRRAVSTARSRAPRWMPPHAG